jgi:hypothetical protein
MGMRVVADYTVPPPRPCTITVTCNFEHGPGGPAQETFDCTDCPPRQPPTRAGWKITADGLVLCPEHAK